MNTFDVTVIAQTFFVFILSVWFYTWCNDIRRSLKMINSRLSRISRSKQIIGTALLTIIPVNECFSQASEVVVPAIQGETYYVEAKGDYIQLYRNESYVKFTQQFTSIEVLCRMSASAYNAPFKPILSAETDSAHDDKFVNSNEWEWVKFRIPGNELTLSLKNDKHTSGYDINIDVKSVKFTHESDMATYLLSWESPKQDPAKPVHGYIVYFGRSPGRQKFIDSGINELGIVWNNFYEHKAVTDNAQSHEIEWPQNANLYAIVTAYNSAGESMPSNEVSAMSIVDISRPDPPTLRLEKRQ